MFNYPKPIELINRFLVLITKNDTILDFFSGSGTTGHAVLKLNKEDNGERKFILVELGQYFDTVTLPRIKKVMYSDNRKDGKAVDNNGSQIITEYLYLNQYEDRFNAGGYLDTIEDEIRTFEQTTITDDTDIKHLILPLQSLKDRIFALDDDIGRSNIH